MKLAIFGATGFTGRSVLRMALAQGHQVRALVRNPGKLDLRHPALELVEGDALDIDDVRTVLRGTDGVLHCLGVGGKGDGRRTTLVSDSVRLVLTVMEELRIHRLVCMSNVGAGGSGPWLVNKIVVPLFLRWLLPLIEDKDRMEALLRDSSVDWLSARFPNIVEGPEKSVRTSEDGTGISLNITTDSVAAYLLQQVTAAELGLRTPSVSN